MEATWASSRVQCSSPSPSPGWTRWSWATPTPCVSGRNRNRHAKAQTWAKAPAQARRLKPLYPTGSFHHPSSHPPPFPPADAAPRRLLKQTLNCSFLSCLLLWCWWAVLSHIHTFRPPPYLFRPSHTEVLKGPPRPAVLWETCSIAAAFGTHLALFAGSPSADRLWAGNSAVDLCE